MKVKQFLKMNSDGYCSQIVITKNKEKIYSGDIKKYLETKNLINGAIKSLDVYVENYDYPVLEIEIE